MTTLVQGRYVKLQAVFDSGSEVNLISSVHVAGMKLLPNDTTVRSVGGSQVRCYGRICRRIYLRDDFGTQRSQISHFEVVDMLDEAILGMPWLKQVNPRILWKEGHWNYALAAQDLRYVRPGRSVRRVASQSKQLVLLQKEIPQDDNVGSPEGSSRRLVELPQQYSDYAQVFSEEKAAELPPLTGPQHEIQLEEGKSPPWGPIYALAASELKELNEYIETALQHGWIRRSTSPAGAPVLFVPKKGGKLRLCVDYRGLNQITRKNRAPLPLINEILDRLQGSAIYTKLDLKDAYRRIRIKEGDEWKTAFRCRYGHFEYVVMPFGLTNAPATFQEYINEVLRGLVDNICIVYLDDILIFSSDPATHTQHVRSVLERLQQGSLFANLAKCEFAVNEVEFLGFVISPGAVKMEPSRIQAITDWPIPRSVKAVQSFLGFTGFYRRFIQNYAKITVPLTELTKAKNTGTLQLPPRALAAFQQLQALFTKAPILAQFDPQAKIKIETDASDYAIGAILSQLQGDRWHPVAFLSRKCRGPEIPLQTPDKEMLAITEAFRQWRHYLAYSPQPVRVYTDHLNHTFLAAKTKLSHKQIAAFDLLAPFNFEIIHQKGKLNPADPLSRRSDYQIQGEKEQADRHYLATFLQRFTSDNIEQASQKGYRVSAMRVWRGGSETVAYPALEQSLAEALREAQKGDALIAQIQKSDRSDDADKPMRSYWKKGSDQLFRFQGRIYVPGGLRAEILQLLHDDPTAGHQGVSRTIRRVADLYYWPGMRKMIKEYVLSCANCQIVKAKHHRPYGYLAAMPQTTIPWHEVSMDLITGLPKSEGRHKSYDAIFVIVDRATRYSIYVPTTQKATSALLAELYVDHVAKYFGFPQAITSDRGSVFTANFWRSFCHLLAIKRRLSTAFHPQTDGLTERVNHQVEQYLRLFCDDAQILWADKLQLAQFAHNTAVNSATGYTPAYLMFGTEPIGPATITSKAGQSVSAEDRVRSLRHARDLADKNLSKAQEDNARWYNRKHKPIHFKKGDLVMLSTQHLNLQIPSRKLAAKFLGPFRVLEEVGAHGLAYRLDLPPTMKIHDVVNITRLEPFVSRDSSTIPQQPSIELVQDTYEVQQILGHKYNGKRRLYKVRWRGYGEEDDSWVRRRDFVDPSWPTQYDNLQSQ